MTNIQLMRKCLETKVIQPLIDQGYIGKYPHFKREKENCIELITFQTNKHGGSFTVEVSAVFPNKENKNYVLYNDKEIKDLNVWDTNIRYRLKGMYDGWFYYRDLYSKYIFGFGKDYIDISDQDLLLDQLAQDYPFTINFSLGKTYLEVSDETQFTYYVSLLFSLY
mgnify:CR=1 FL=1